jgi:hypothetical protein
MGVICLLIVLVMPVVYLLDLIPLQKEVIASVFFGMGAMAVQIIIVAPKAAILLKGLDIGGVDGKLVEQVRPLKYAQIIHLPAASSRQKKEEHALKKAIKVHEREEAQELQVAGLHIKGDLVDGDDGAGAFAELLEDVVDHELRLLGAHGDRCGCGGECHVTASFENPRSMRIMAFCGKAASSFTSTPWRHLRSL